MIIACIRRSLLTSRAVASNFRTVSTEAAKSEKTPRDAIVARIIAGLFLFGAGIKITPFAAGALVEHTVKLMQTDVPFLQSAGLDRLYYLLYFTAARRKALETGAVEAMTNICLELSPTQQYKYLEILGKLSHCEGFEGHLDCPMLKNLLFSLEEQQLDVSTSGRNVKLASAYHTARTLFKQHCQGLRG